MEKHEAKTRLLDLRSIRVPMFNPDTPNEHHQQMEKVIEDLNWADAFVLASPDYHGSMSGAMKNFLDFYWEEFAGKTFGYICSSHEKGSNGNGSNAYSCTSMLRMEPPLWCFHKWRGRLQ
jgi:azobenzene reductase